MVMAAQLAVSTLEALRMPKEHQVYIWCDAQVVLSWVSSEDLSNTYVHERVKQIRDLCPTAKVAYVDTKGNPADIITRKQKSPEEFCENNNWWEGPR